MTTTQHGLLYVEILYPMLVDLKTWNQFSSIISHSACDLTFYVGLQITLGSTSPLLVDTYLGLCEADAYLQNLHGNHA